MEKVTDLGLAPPDDPMFTGGVEFFSVRKKPTPTVEGMTEEQRAAMEKVAKMFDTNPKSLE
jgi:hypothetical protein